MARVSSKIKFLKDDSGKGSSIQKQQKKPTILPLIK